MGSLLANTCWPSQFWTKWLTFFFASMVLGMVIYKLTHPANSVQAIFKVYVSSPTGESQRVTADLYYLNPGQKLDDAEQRDDSIHVPNNGPGANKTDTADILKHFKVVIKNPSLKANANFKWPDKKGTYVNITIDREHPDQEAKVEYMAPHPQLGNTRTNGNIRP